VETSGKNYEIIEEDNWIRIRVKSNTMITADLITRILGELYSMNAYRADKIAGLWDFRGCMTDINYESMMSIKKYIDMSYDPNWSHSITAFVVDHDLLYGLSRMYELISDDLPTTLKIFKDMNNAENWIREEIILKKDRN
jgi:hypothetical protein